MVKVSILVFGIAGCSGAAEPVRSTPQRAPQSSTSEAASTTAADAPRELPVKFVENRIFVTPKTVSGEALVFYTDTGGGLFIFEETVKRFDLPITKVEADGDAVDAAPLPAFAPSASIPSFQALGGHLPIIKRNARHTEVFDGMLGQVWFKERVWTFDYGKEKLYLHGKKPLPNDSADSAHRVSLGFKIASDGRRATNYPRIQIAVDGEVIELLFDTGATVNLSASALKVLGDGRPSLRATSFISKTTFERWKQKHPDWKIINDADQNVGGEPMIEVPSIEVAGFKVGPVWFTRRADANFHEWMSQWMDRKIDGALGGNALGFFRVTVDYPNAIAVFERGPI